MATRETLERKFRAFHADNPHVYDSLAQIVQTALDRGYTRWSIASAFEILRWSSMETTGEPFKLKNEYRAFYSRLLSSNKVVPEHFFVQKPSKADGIEECYDEDGWGSWEDWR